MTTIRWGLASTDVVPAGSKIRWGQASTEGGAPPSPKIRWGQASTEGTFAVIVSPIQNYPNTEPETVLTVTASLTSGDAADVWTWRRISGDATSISGTGATVDITAPSNLNGTTVVIGVRATKDGTQSPEVSFTITVLPQTEWWWTGTGWLSKTEVWA